eukprot:TRINITY_DN3854_c0_g1_i2.p1 TRINITY_DN3854_c0_g1~~TRINITY_DN3854_c0_g1_i2.p1  ORF type:complete len:459 (-),score=123.26 TRINITY_DN3854_c0_g1_i2:940-2316(-)
MMQLKQDQLNRLKFEVMMMRKEIAQEESNLYEREKKIVSVNSQNKEAKTAIIIQKAVRKFLIYRKYKSPEALIYPVIQEYLMSDASTVERTRWKFIKEIYSSQEAYLSNLKVIYEKYIVPLQDLSQKPSTNISEQDINMIFGSLETVYMLNNSVLQEYKQRIYDRFLSPNVGDIFAKMGPIFLLYEQYSKDYFEAVYYLKRLQKTKIHLFTVLQRLQSESKSTTLLSLLELPCKRLFHYKTLMTELLKCTSEEHLDYIFLKDAISKVDVAIEGVKVYQLTAKDSQVVRDIEERIEELPTNIIPLGIPGRVFLEQTEMYQIEDPKKPKSRSKYHFFLFNDLLIKTKFDKKKYTFSSAISLSGAFLDELDGNSSYEKDGFQIRTLNDLFTFAVLDPNTKFSTVKSIKKALETSHLADPKKHNVVRRSIQQSKLECVAALKTQELNYLPKKTVELRQKKQI